MSLPPLELTAFATGELVALASVPDPVFSQGLLGEGIAIEPDHGVLYAPCTGRIVQIQSAHHACILEADNGARLVLHIGIDTVQLKGQGFTLRVAEGEHVRAGQPLIEFSISFLRSQGKPSVTLMVVENSAAYPILDRTQKRSLSRGDLLLTLARVPQKAHQASPAPTTPTLPRQDESASGWVIVNHPGGMHARPCALLVNALKPFHAQVEAVAHGRRANARSATALMSLGIGEGEEMEIIATGVDAKESLLAAMDVLEASNAEPLHTTLSQPSMPEESVDLLPGELAGVSASPGLAIGKVFYFNPRAGITIPEEGSDPQQEQQALLTALQKVTHHIQASATEAMRRRHVDQADIFAAHVALVEDPHLLAQAMQYLTKGKSAAFAWHRATESRCAALQDTGNTLLIGRVSDLRDIERQVLHQLLPAPTLPQQAIPPGVILVAEDLLPSDFPVISKAGIAAIATEKGGPTSHVAILARGQGIPALVALGPLVGFVAEGTLAILDANRGAFDASPSQARLATAQENIHQQKAVKTEALAKASQPALTTDRVPIEVAANIASLDDAIQAVQWGADAIGLLRTELLFLDRQQAPSESEQTASYQAVLNALQGRRIIIRTLDVGADKSVAYIPMPPESNPALGLRGIRFSLAEEDLLKEQLRAILALRPLTTVRVMLPMVTDVNELKTVRTMLHQLAREMRLETKVMLGAMIETPAAAVLADQLAEVADFISIGTNDLTQYALCMDRGNPALAARIDAFHPTVLRLIHMTTQGASQHNRWVGVCGAMASDPLALPILLGLGVVELSVSPAMVPEIKAAVRNLHLGQSQQFAASVLQLSSAEAVRAHVQEAYPWLAHHCVNPS